LIVVLDTGAAARVVLRKPGFEKEAFALAGRVRAPAYDMFFLVLARRNGALLLTDDKALKENAGRYAVRTSPP
jgi:predicted nucleic acid-binding protein